MTWLPFIRAHVKPAQAVAGVAMTILFLITADALIIAFGG
jgi:hypothetical protein